MKQFFTLFILLVLSQLSTAQQNTNLVFFSEQGQQFYIVLNGVQQNVNPETNVRVTNLIQPYYKVKVKFTDGMTPDIDKTINFNPGTETTYTIRNSNKGEVVLRWMSEVPIQQAPQPMPNQQVIIYHSTPPVTTVTQTTVISSTTTNPSNSEQINMGVNVNDPMNGGTNININVNGTGMNNQTQSTTTTYSTTTTTSGNVGTVQQSQSAYVMPGYNGNVGCNGYPMSETRFNEVVQSIKSKSFDDSKLTMAKQVINTNCMTSGQVKRLMLLFSFEDTRLDLAKYAYGYTYDIGNYYQLNDAFTFESSIDELNAYTSGFRR
ncbi:DUF4476 domain-containing protein [Fluviicola taffensis]|uniref:DUF4476 domain-containing protein n=1 Tax=Fluviicola taffensis (strain DSM 16823 / NCIMB 13979 / RW262) TaxID=755732 RepID=F2IJH9_FLUTR|nr:DUF4476 domain-containing protein [Fluviicola taffensis]AEA42867.1 hypothetical protein Fluta_0866 [Fluviicola taffensis DSM 16823]